MRPRMTHLSVTARTGHGADQAAIERLESVLHAQSTVYMSLLRLADVHEHAAISVRIGVSA